MKNIICMLFIILIIASCSVSPSSGSDDKYSRLDIVYDDSLEHVGGFPFEGEGPLRRFGIIMTSYKSYSDEICFYYGGMLPAMRSMRKYSYYSNEISAFYLIDSTLYMSIDNEIFIVELGVDFRVEETYRTEMDASYDCLIVIDSTIIASNKDNGVSLFRVDSLSNVNQIYHDSVLRPDTMIKWNDYIYAVDNERVSIYCLENDSLFLQKSILDYGTDNIKIEDDKLIYCRYDETIGFVNMNDGLNLEEVYWQNMKLHDINDYTMLDSILYVSAIPDNFGENKKYLLKYRYDSDRGFVFEGYFDSKEISSMVNIMDYAVMSSGDILLVFEK
ncbi:MAG: hypothetical protein SVK54_04090 [candidate division WOR-3 bacterium]|nr:hypothetical protein [candidate division WOR-3 bacterium]